MKTYKNPLTIIKSESPEPFVPTPSLVYTLSSDGTYYIVGTGFTTIEAIQADTSGGTSGSGLDNTWQGGEINIPATHNNLPVKAIAPRAFSGITNTTKLVIEDGEMLTIGHRAFQVDPVYDTNLKEITLPNTLIYLGGSASRVFWGRSGLEKLYYRCTNLQTVGQPNENIMFNNVASETQDGLSIIVSKNVLHIPARLIYYHSPQLIIKTIEFEDNSLCLSIGEYAFYGFKGINLTIILGKSLQEIGNGAFATVYNDDRLNTYIYCKSINPPILGSNALGSITGTTGQTAKIYVPAESVEAYKTATNWSAYASIIEAIPV